MDEPFKKGRRLAPTGGAPIQVSFKYEKLFNFCYRCGRLNNVVHFCDEEEKEPLLPFGSLLRAEEDRRHGGRNRGWRALVDEEKNLDEEEGHDHVNEHANVTIDGGGAADGAREVQENAQVTKLAPAQVEETTKTEGGHFQDGSEH